MEFIKEGINKKKNFHRVEREKHTHTCAFNNAQIREEITMWIVMSKLKHNNILENK